MFIQDAADQRHKRRFDRRAVLLGVAQTAGIGVLATRLYQLQVMEKDRYAPLSDDNRLTAQVLAPERGRILDRFGVVLAANRDEYRAVIIPSLARDLKLVLRRFARIVPLSDKRLAQIMKRARRQRPNRPITVATGLTWEDFSTINLLAPRLPGIRTDVFGRRQYFHGHSVGHVVGYVGAVQRRALGDDPVLRLPGMRVGRTGVERGADVRLRGRGGQVSFEIDARGRIIRQLAKREPERGEDLVLTIDTQLQAHALKLLEGYRRGALVVIDVAGGDVIAMVSSPTYDPQLLVDGISAREWQRIANAADDPMLNRTIRGQYPPGSTFKMVTLLAGLEAGIITPRTRVRCRGSFKLADQTFRCWNRSGHGVVDLHRSLRESCDTYYYELATKIGIRRIAAMARRLGLGQTYPCDIALQKAGLIPDPAWKRGRFNRGWYHGETVLASIGQGFVLTTPLQLAVMTARLATGEAVVPTIVHNKERTPFEPLGIRPEHLEQVRRAMHAVVNEDGGTGTKAQLSTGTIEVAGKTGTAQVSRKSASFKPEDLPWRERDHSLFVGYMPSAQPRYAVAAVIEHGGGGGGAAASVVRETMQWLVDRDPIARPAYRPPTHVNTSAGPADGRG
ncbi:MAG: penicillin-binding protein 2 [Pseudomonadota bacterium]